MQTLIFLSYLVGSNLKTCRVRWKGSYIGLKRKEQPWPWEQAASRDKTVYDLLSKDYTVSRLDSRWSMLDSCYLKMTFSQIFLLLSSRLYCQYLEALFANELFTRRYTYNVSLLRSIIATQLYFILRKYPVLMVFQKQPTNTRFPSNFFC